MSKSKEINAIAERLKHSHGGVDCMASAALKEAAACILTQETQITQLIKHNGNLGREVKDLERKVHQLSTERNSLHEQLEKVRQDILAELPVLEHLNDRFGEVCKERDDAHAEITRLRNHNQLLLSDCNTWAREVKTEQRLSFRTDRDKALDALGAAVKALENLDHPDGCKSGYAKDTGEGVWFNEMWPEKCDCGRNAAITQAKEILK